MAAHARQLPAQQGLHALSMPVGEPAPFVHCYADDTTIHAASPIDAVAILAGSITSRPLGQDADSKSTGMGQYLAGPDAATGIIFSAAGSATTHLGIPLSTDPDAAARSLLYTDIPQRFDRRIERWSGFRLNLLGRAHVVKQVLMSMFTHHETFLPVPADVLRQLCTLVYTFVVANRQPRAQRRCFPAGLSPPGSK